MVLPGTVSYLRVDTYSLHKIVYLASTPRPLIYIHGKAKRMKVCAKNKTRPEKNGESRCSERSKELSGEILLAACWRLSHESPKPNQSRVRVP